MWKIDHRRQETETWRPARGDSSGPGGRQQWLGPGWWLWRGWDQSDCVSPLLENLFLLKHTKLPSSSRSLFSGWTTCHPPCHRRRVSAWIAPPSDTLFSRAPFPSSFLFTACITPHSTFSSLVFVIDSPTGRKVGSVKAGSLLTVASPTFVEHEWGAWGRAGEAFLLWEEGSSAGMLGKHD